MTAANSMHIRAAHHLRHASAGFSLIEMAVVLMIMTLVLGGLLMPLSAQIEQRNRTETQRALEDAKEALIGFAIVNRRLPCPDTNNDGVANPDIPTNICEDDEGLLPYATLGIERGDGWFNRIGYRITNTAGNPWANEIQVNLSGEITIATRGDNPATTTVESKFQYPIATVPAVLISFGKNGYGATGIDGEIRTTVPTVNADETTNANPGNTKFSRLPANAVAGCSDTVEGEPACEFDDMIAWLSPNILFNRMAVAGRLHGPGASMNGTIVNNPDGTSTLTGDITWP